MNDARDPLLEGLFSNTHVSADDEAFVATVMEQASKSNRRGLIITTLLKLAAGLGIAFYLTPLVDPFFQLLFQPIVGIDAGLAAPILGPVNNVAGLAALLLLLIPRLYRWLNY